MKDTDYHWEFKELFMISHTGFKSCYSQMSS